MSFYLGGNMYKVNLYIGSRKVKTKILWNVNEFMPKLIKQDYKVTLIGQKDIMNKFIATTFLRPVTLLNDPTNKEVNLNCNIYGGANIE